MSEKTYRVRAACLCNTGKVRRNNEDNYFFRGRCLPELNAGSPEMLTLETRLDAPLRFAVFDGMGGENYGEAAAFAAADCMVRLYERTQYFGVSEALALEQLCQQLNLAVVKRAQELCTSRMGTTLAVLSLLPGRCWSCNLGDSRVYRLRGARLEQLSVDHVEHRQISNRKPPLTQHLGIDPEELILEPSIREEALASGDRFLLCSDGLTDMLSDSKLSVLLRQDTDLDDCARRLTEAALAKGGRDNITVIVCDYLED